MEGTQGESPRQILTSFVKQYYASASHIPRLILLQHSVDEPMVLSEWLAHQRGNRVELQVPQRGAKRKLVDTAAENAAQRLALLSANQQGQSLALVVDGQVVKALAIRDELGLEGLELGPFKKDLAQKLQQRIAAK